MNTEHRQSAIVISYEVRTGKISKKRHGDWLVTTNWHSFGPQVQKGAFLADTLSELIISCVTKKTSGALSMTILYPHHSGHGPNVVSFLQPRS